MTDQPFGTAEPDEGFRNPLASGGEGPEMARIPSGSFTMGAGPDDPEHGSYEKPCIEVAFAEDFAIARAPITFEEYDRFAKAAGYAPPCDYGFGRGDRPVINVTWLEARAYCDWLTQETGFSHDLPSEAAWEYACRAGQSAPFMTGTDITTAEANFDPSCDDDPIGFRDSTVEVRSFSPNPWGLYDMHGNVGEWCADRWSDTHEGAAPDATPRPVDLDDPMCSVVVRGGGWSTKKRYIRASERWHYAPTARFEMLGFRVSQRLS